MKKIICFLVALMLISSIAIAEEFSLHSGVEFGMSRDEIHKVENDAGFEVIDKDKNDYLIISGKIASIEDSEIFYYFKDDKMHIAEYSLGGGFVPIGNDYSMIHDSLVERYGEPTGLPLYTDPFKEEYKNDGYLKRVFEKEEGWFLQADDGYIAIEHYYFYIDFDGKIDYHKIVYQKYDLDDPDINAALSNIEENAAQLKNDL